MPVSLPGGHARVSQLASSSSITASGVLSVHGPASPELGSCKGSCKIWLTLGLCFSVSGSAIRRPLQPLSC